MELVLTTILAVLSGLCVLTKIVCLHNRQRQISHLGVEVREYQQAQRELKAVLHEENRIRARDQGLGRNETHLLRDLGKIRHRLARLRREDGSGKRAAARKRQTTVER